MTLEAAFELVQTGEWTMQEFQEWVWSLTSRAYAIGWKSGQKAA